MAKMEQPRGSTAEGPGAAPSAANDNLQDATPKPLTLSQNVILTIKVLVGAGILLGIFWLLDRGK